MQSSADLKQLLNRIDRKSYPAYKDTRGAYQFPGYVLSIDHVQGDPFAAPSKVSIHVKGKQAGFPPELYATPWQRIALQDALTRRFGRLAGQASFQAKGSGHSGLLAVSRCRQEVLERTACRLEPKSGDLLLRLEVGFPANGRTINARELEKILFDLLPRCVQGALLYPNWDAGELRAVSHLAEDQQAIREALPKLGLCAFVADGSILPRASGISPLPMKGAVPFQSPPGAGGDSGAAPPWKAHRHGDQAGGNPDRGRRLPRQVHPAEGPGAGGVQPHRRGRTGVRHHRRHRRENPG